MSIRNSFLVDRKNLFATEIVISRRIESLCEMISDTPELFPEGDDNELLTRDIHGKILAIFGVAEMQGEKNSEILAELHFSPEISSQLLEIIPLCEINIDVKKIMEKLQVLKTNFFEDKKVA